MTKKINLDRFFSNLFAKKQAMKASKTASYSSAYEKTGKRQAWKSIVAAMLLSAIGSVGVADDRTYTIDGTNGGTAPNTTHTTWASAYDTALNGTIDGNQALAGDTLEFIFDDSISTVNSGSTFTFGAGSGGLGANEHLAAISIIGSTTAVGGTTFTDNGGFIEQILDIDGGDVTLANLTFTLHGTMTETANGYGAVHIGRDGLASDGLGPILGDINITNVLFDANILDNSLNSARGGALAIDGITRNSLVAPYGDVNSGNVVLGVDGDDTQAVKFTNNRVITRVASNNARGGGLHAMGVASFTMYGGEFNTNSAEYSGTGANNGSAFAAGGAAYFGQYADNTISFVGTVFENNKAIASGAATNGAGAFGGAIRVVTGSGDTGTYETVLNFTETLFADNEAFVGTGNAGMAAGGAVDMRGSVAATFTNGQLSGNKAVSGDGAGYGGALSFSQDGIPTGDGSLEIDGTTFISNLAGGTSAQGGAVYTNVATTISSAIFGNATDNTKGNTAISTAGDALGGALAYYTVGTTKAADLTIDGESAFYYNAIDATGGDALGGAVYIGGDKTGTAINIGTVTIGSTADTVIFANNSATAAGGSARGGALTIDAITDNSGTLTSTGTVEITNVEFTENEVTATGAVGHARGGAMNVMGVEDFEMTGATFTENKAIYDGSGNSAGDFAAAGAAYFGQYAANTIQISDTTFEENSAVTHGDNGTGAVGGAIRIVTGAGQTGSYMTTATFDGVTFNGNFVGSDNVANTTGNIAGGAIDIRGSVDATFTDTEFTGNFAASAGGGVVGGALSMSQDGITTGDGSLTIENSSFTANIAQGVTSALGGAIFISLDTTTTITDTDFTDNHASVEAGGTALGGAIYAGSDTTIKASTKDVEFSGNYVEIDGVQTDNSIYIATGKTVTFQTENGKVITIKDGVSGPGTMNIAANSTVVYDGLTDHTVNLTGTGTLQILTGDNDDEFEFATGTGSAFAGTVDLAQGVMVLNGSLITSNYNATALTNATLKLSGDSAEDTMGTLQVTADSTIGNLEFAGGTLDIAMDPVAVPDGVLSVTDLDVSGGGTVIVSGLSDEINTNALTTDSLFDYAESTDAYQVLLVSASGTVTSGQLDVFDESGNELTPEMTRDISNGTETVGEATFGVAASTKTTGTDKGLYLGYTLTEIESFEDKIVLLDASTGSGDSITAKLTGKGGFTFAGDKNISVGNADSDYEGATTVSLTDATDNTLTLLADDAFGKTEGLYIRAGNVDLDDHDLTVGSLMGEIGTSVIISSNSTFTIGNDNSPASATFNGDLTGDGEFVMDAPGTTQTLTGTNTGFTGKTSIEQGTLALEDNGSLANSSEIAVAEDGTFDISGVTASTEIKALSGDGTVNLGAKDLSIGNDDGTDTEFAGTFSGTGELSKTGDSVLTLSGDSSATFSGEVNVEDGELIAKDAGALGSGLVNVGGDGTLTLDFDGIFANDVAGFAGTYGIIDTMGNVTFSGDMSMFQGDVFVKDGSILTLDTNSATGNYTIEDGGILTGTGVVGDLTFEDGSAYNVAINGANVNLITVSGMLDIEDGALLNVKIAGLAFGQSQTYTILDGDASGLLDGFDLNDITKGYNVTQSWDGNGYYLTVARNAPNFSNEVAGYATSNAMEVAGGIDESVFFGDYDGIEDLIRAVDSMDGPQAKADALAQLHGEAYAASREAGVLTQYSFLRNLKNARESYLANTSCTDPCKGCNLWGTLTGDWSTRSSIDSYSGYDLNAFGLAIGCDKYVTGNMFLGVALGYDNVSQKFDDIRSKTEFDAFRTLLYGGWSDNLNFIDGYVGYSKNWYKTNRNIDIGTGSDALSRAARGKYDDNVLSVGIEYGRKYCFEHFDVTPSIGLHYVYLDSPDVTETGAGSANLHVYGDSYNSLRLPIGAKLSRTFNQQGTSYNPYAAQPLLSRIAWTPEFRAFYIAELADDESSVWTSFQGDRSTAFRASSGSWGTSSGLFGVGLKAELSNCFHLRLDYNHQVYSHTDIGEFSVSAGFNW